jgi:hypothetical protein
MMAPLSEIKQKNFINERKSLKKVNFQKGGTIIQDIAEFFREIPFCLYKILPRILFNLLNPLNLLKFKFYYTPMTDDLLVTRYGNGRSCIFQEVLDSPDGFNLLPGDYVIWLDHFMNVYRKADETFEIETKFFTLNRNNITLQDIISIIQIPWWNPFNRLTRSRFVENIDRDAIRAYLTELADESTQSAGAKDDDDNVSLVKLLIPNNPKLNVFLNFFYNNDISLDKEKLTTNNFLALSAYLSIFDRYEINMCFDNDKYEQDFIKISKSLPEVSNKTSMYLFFKFLLEDFPEQHDKICYGLMEYFINEGDGNNNY